MESELIEGALLDEFFEDGEEFFKVDLIEDSQGGVGVGGGVVLLEDLDVI
jgi:hypothetical protein